MRKLVCWDMDETLGSFRSGKPALAKDIRRVLQKLKEAGCAHAITTISTAGIARQHMKETCLASYFDGIFGLKDVLAAGRGKSYAKAASEMGIFNPSHEMIIVGNDILDAPVDTDSVFLLHPNAIQHSAEVFFTLIDELGKHGSWKAGFDAMQSRTTETLLVPDFTGGMLIVDGISVALGELGLKGRIVPNVLLVNQVPEKYGK